MYNDALISLPARCSVGQECSLELWERKCRRNVRMWILTVGVGPRWLAT
jgi:hypothetical protein